MAERNFNTDIAELRSYNYAWGCYAYAMLGKQGQREKETKKKTKTDTKAIMQWGALSSSVIRASDLRTLRQIRFLPARNIFWAFWWLIFISSKFNENV